MELGSADMQHDVVVVGVAAKKRPCLWGLHKELGKEVAILAANELEEQATQHETCQNRAWEGRVRRSVRNSRPGMELAMVAGTWAAVWVRQKYKVVEIQVCIGRDWESVLYTWRAWQIEDDVREQVKQHDTSSAVRVRMCGTCWMELEKDRETWLKELESGRDTYWREPETVLCRLDWDWERVSEFFDDHSHGVVCVVPLSVVGMESWQPPPSMATKLESSSEVPGQAQWPSSCWNMAKTSSSAGGPCPVCFLASCIHRLCSQTLCSPEMAS